MSLNNPFPLGIESKRSAISKLKIINKVPENGITKRIAPMPAKIPDRLNRYYVILETDEFYSLSQRAHNW